MRLGNPKMPSLYRVYILRFTRNVATSTRGAITQKLSRRVSSWFEISFVLLPATRPIDAFGKGHLYVDGAAATHVDEDFQNGVKFLTMAIDRFRNEKSHTADGNISDPIRAYEYLRLAALPCISWKELRAVPRRSQSLDRDDATTSSSRIATAKNTCWLTNKDWDKLQKSTESVFKSPSLSAEPINIRYWLPGGQLCGAEGFGHQARVRRGTRSEFRAAVSVISFLVFGEFIFPPSRHLAVETV